MLSTDDCPRTGPDEVVVLLLSTTNGPGGGSGCTINSGLCVASVVEGSAVDASGVQVGDRLIRIGTENLISGVNGNKFSKVTKLSFFHVNL